MLRTALTYLYRSLVFICFSALMVVLSLRYGPSLFAEMLPEDMRPAPEDVAGMTPQRIMDALRDIRGTLE